MLDTFLVSMFLMGCVWSAVLTYSFVRYMRNRKIERIRRRLDYYA